ncbi:hypothetical protein SAMN05428947_10247 [Mucilaginibacter sp. OK283]|nr:hypothetical protein SAMN05428947_10247 [Mucilaginibacter sp. OK283]
MRRIKQVLLQVHILFVTGVSFFEIYCASCIMPATTGFGNVNVVPHLRRLCWSQNEKTSIKYDFTEV